MNSETIETIDIWTLRILLVTGAIVLECFGKAEAAATCILVCIFSFWFVD